MKRQWPVLLFLILAGCFSGTMKGVSVSSIQYLPVASIENQENRVDPQVVVPQAVAIQNNTDTETNRKFSPDSYGNCYALLIANSNYRTLSNLQSPGNDANDLQNTLKKKYGFKVKLLFDANRENIFDALYSYRQSLTEKDNLLVFYAGHGWMDKEADEGYWLPVDASPDNPSNWISNSAITSTLKAIRAKHVVVLSDSCYSGALTRGIEIHQNTAYDVGGIATKKARIVISSGGVEPVLDVGGSKGHSVFAAALLETFEQHKGIMDATTLFSTLRSKVTWNADQTPELGVIHKAGHDGGDFLFIPLLQEENR